MQIEFETRGTTYYQHETSISFNIEGVEYWFTLIEKGDDSLNLTKEENNSFDFETDEELPFELTDEMKNEMYELASINHGG